MTSLFDFTAHHDTAGVNAIFAFTFLTTAIYLGGIAYSGRGRGFDDINRMAVGLKIMCIGVAVRIGFWIPWRALLAVGDQANADWYRSFSYLWTWGGVIIALAGLLVIIHPALNRWLGKWAGVAVLVGISMFYLAGVFTAEYLAQLF